MAEHEQEPNAEVVQGEATPDEEQQAVVPQGESAVATIAQAERSLLAQRQAILGDLSKDYTATREVYKLPLLIPTPDDIRDRVRNIQDERKVRVTTDKLEEIVSALASGKHVVLYGPPGTGKTTIANAIAEELFNCSSTLITASAEWSAYDTIGGTRMAPNGKPEPFLGVITKEILECAMTVKEHRRTELLGVPAGRQAKWLVLDELNRAKMDAALGPLFTALDAATPRISLEFFFDDEKKQALYVPNRFRIIATMNTYDKNFLFRVSYALSRRFAFIYIGIPETREEIEAERELVLVKASQECLPVLQGVISVPQGKSAEEYLTDKYRAACDKLSGFLVLIRRGESVKREIGTAQYIDSVKNVIMQCELFGLDEITDVQLDKAVNAHIAPQLEGLGNQLEALANQISKPPYNFERTAATLKRYVTRL